MSEKVKFHPVSTIFRLLEGDDFDSLVESIKSDGLLNAIWIHPDDGSIIDGRNRYRACVKAKVAPRYQEWDGKGSLTDFVVDQNIERRHLDGTEKAILAVDLEPFYHEESKEKQRQSPGRPKKVRKKFLKLKSASSRRATRLRRRRRRTPIMFRT